MIIIIYLQIEIKTALERGGPRDSSRSESIKIIEQLKAVRVRIRDGSAEKEEITLQLRDLKNSREAQLKHITDMRKSLKYDDPRQVDEKIQELEKKISHGQCSDLKEEKRILMEIKQLSQMKSLITQFQAVRLTVGDDSQLREDLEKRRALASAKLESAKKEADDLEKALEGLRGNKKSETVLSKGDLWKEQKALYGQIKEHRAEIRTVRLFLNFTASFT